MVLRSWHTNPNKWLLGEVCSAWVCNTVQWYPVFVPSKITTKTAVPARGLTSDKCGDRRLPGKRGATGMHKADGPNLTSQCSPFFSLLCVFFVLNVTPL